MINPEMDEKLYDYFIELMVERGASAFRLGDALASDRVEECMRALVQAIDESMKKEGVQYD